MKLHLRKLVLAAVFAGTPGIAFAADDWQAKVGEALGKTGAPANDDAVKLAEGLKAALAQINIAKS